MILFPIFLMGTDAVSKITKFTVFKTCAGPLEHCLSDFWSSYAKISAYQWPKCLKSGKKVRKDKFFV